MGLWRTVKFKTLWGMVSLFLGTTEVTAADPSPSSDVSLSATEAFAPIVPKLKRRGIKQAFLDRVFQEPSTRFEEKALTLAMLQFSTAPPSYAYATSQEALEKAQQFIEQHTADLELCEKKTGIDRESITALMWVETRLGTITGKYSVASVYLTFAMANQKDVLERIRAKFETSFVGTEPEKKAARKKLEKRAKYYAEWGAQEVGALQKIDKKYGGNFLPTIEKLQGSWAGAFGMAQFIPSTYYRLAQDGNGDLKLDPYSVADSACSVGHFLKRHGWAKAEKRRRKALLRYNRSRDYGEAILTLSKQLKQSREIASQKN